MKILIVSKASISDDIASYVKNINDEVELVLSDGFDDALLKIKSDKDIQFVIIDADDENLNWCLCVGEVFKKYPKHRIVVFAKSKKLKDFEFCLRHKVSGYIPKEFSSEQLYHAFGFVLAGGDFYPTLLSEKNRFNTRFLNEDNQTPKTEPCLTNRQGEVLINLCKGLSNKQIAHEMNVAEATVKLHVNALLRSLNVTNRTHAVVRAQKLGIV